MDFYENTVTRIEPYKKQLVYGAVGLVGAIVLFAIVSMVMSYQSSQSQAALARALEIYNAPIVTPGQDAERFKGKKTYADKQQKYKEAAAAFDDVAANHSAVRDVARYWAAMSRAQFDPTKAQTDLEALSKESSDIGFWSKIGLAETYAATEQTDRAIGLYQQLKDNSGPLPKSVILYNLGRLYERQNKTTEAIDAYFQAASANRSSDEGRKSEERLNVLAPDKVKTLPAEVKNEDDI